ncbi:MAG: energy-coupling factor ABC transporter substrate-binding protein [Steroidobacteraceae bacterium]|nr:energy-coupling factor ABC transporter substrate-binding protein [Deltaproteobacteria bacterium]
MSSRLKNFLLIVAVAVLTILPLLMVKKTAFGPDDQPAGMFKGSDSQAEGVIRAIAPDYKPWFHSLLKPASSEIESLLFALQAALGAGFIGYYVGYSRGRAKQNSTPPVT